MLIQDFAKQDLHHLSYGNIQMQIDAHEQSTCECDLTLFELNSQVFENFHASFNS